MRFRPLGNTGLQVSEVSLGTVELGLDYGFRGSQNYGKPSIEDSVYLIHTALDMGVNLLDTARAYGSSEEVIGAALRETSSKPYIVSKVMLSEQAEHNGMVTLRREVFSSIETSLKLLQVETLDLLLIHNATVARVERPDIEICLQDAQRQGKIRWFGASTYGESAPLKVLDNSSFRALQVPYNVLDQKMRRRVFPKAVDRKAGIFVRSAYLRGILTGHLNETPTELAPLKVRALQVCEVARSVCNSLSETALRFCLSHEAVSSVVIGVKTIEELRANLAAAERGSLQQEMLTRLEELSLEDDPLVNPASWQDLV